MKKILLTFKTLIYVSIIFFIWLNKYSNFYLSNNTIIFDQNTPIRNLILDFPTIFYSISPPIYLCIIFTINIFALIFYSYIKNILNKQKNKLFCYFFKITVLSINLLLIIFLLLNFIHVFNGNIWFFSYSDYYLTYFLFLLYIIFFILISYKILSDIKK